MTDLEAMTAALDLTIAMLVRLEPNDSRAVSDEFVGVAAIRAGDRSPEILAFVRTARQRIESLPPPELPEITVTFGEELNQ